MSSDATRPIVLIVEDDEDTREMYTLYLEYSGIEVLSAPNAQDAFELAVTHQPQMVVTDFHLGGVDTGADLCRSLRNHERTTHIPTLLLTGSSRQQEHAAASDVGCTHVRIKPYLPDALVSDIRETIARIGMR